MESIRLSASYYVWYNVKFPNFVSPILKRRQIVFRNYRNMLLDKSHGHAKSPIRKWIKRHKNGQILRHLPAITIVSCNCLCIGNSSTFELNLCETCKLKARCQIRTVFRKLTYWQAVEKFYFIVRDWVRQQLRHFDFCVFSHREFTRYFFYDILFDVAKFT